jgi:hypothetical protein
MVANFVQVNCVRYEWSDDDDDSYDDDNGDSVAPKRTLKTGQSITIITDIVQD